MKIVRERRKTMDFSSVNNSAAQAVNAYGTQETKQSESAKKAESTKGSANYGKCVGQPKLSEKAQKYYEELKAKYKDMDFVLVSKDMKETAKANAAGYANPHRMVVLIDEEKIERMATDEKFRSQYEGLIASAQKNIPELKQKLGSLENVKGYGMQVGDDGRASFFAVMKKSNDQMNARAAKKREEKKAQKKAEEKKNAEKLAEKRADRKADKKDETEKIKETEEIPEWKDLFGESQRDDVEILAAYSVEDLLRRVEDYNFALKSDQVRTQAELMVGNHIDFRT